MAYFDSQGPDPLPPGGGNGPKTDRKIPPAEPSPRPED